MVSSQHTHLPSTETVVAELSFSESVADLRRLAFFSLILQMATAAAMAPPATAVVTIHDVDEEEGISIHLTTAITLVSEYTIGSASDVGQTQIFARYLTFLIQLFSKVLQNKEVRVGCVSVC